MTAPAPKVHSSEYSVPQIPTMTAATVAKVRELESQLSKAPQVDVETFHVLHAGLYARSLNLPAGVALTGALIKIPTVLIVSGSCAMLIGEEEAVQLEGYNVIPAMAGRKQAFITHSDVQMTMLFPTLADTIEQAEREFTDEYERLLSHDEAQRNTVIITGVKP